MKTAGEEVLLLNFKSPFFGGPSERLKETAKSLKLPLVIVDFSQQILSAAQRPQKGYGAAANPCVDCRGLMLREADRIREALHFDYVATGDVLKQHTFSQSIEAFQAEAKLSGVSNGGILRPLSQRLLGESRVTQSFVPCSACSGFSGQSHEKQEELLRAARLSIRSPLRRCLLLDAGFSRRLLALKQDGVFCSKTKALVDLLKAGRLLRFGERQYVFLYKRHEAQCVSAEIKGKTFEIESIADDGAKQNPHRTLIVVLDLSKTQIAPEEPRFAQIDDIEDFVAKSTRPGLCASYPEGATDQWPFAQEEIRPNELLVEFAFQVFQHLGDRNATEVLVNGKQTALPRSTIDTSLLERKLIQ